MTETPKPAARTENDALIEQAVAATQPIQLEPGRVYAVHNRDGYLAFSGADVEEHQRSLAAKRGKYTIHTTESFLAYLRKHATEATEVWCDLKLERITAVIDAHGTNEKGLQQHKAELALQTTRDWKQWTAIDRAYHTQLDMSEFVQDHFDCFVKPGPLEMLEIAETFSATRKVEYKSAQRSKDGTTTFTYEESNQVNGKVKIPDEITVRVAVFENSEPVTVKVRVQYKIDDDKKLYLRFLMDRPEEVKQAVFYLMTEQLAKQIGELPQNPAVYTGTGN